MATFTLGMVSITFRHFSPATIVALMMQAEVYALEWGGDVHVPPGNLLNAHTVASLTNHVKREVTAYGSYYRVGVPGQEGIFESCLQTAAVLGAPLIRVWVGECSSEDADSSARKRIVDDLNRICTQAQTAGIGIATEFHGDTYCDTVESTLRLLTQVESPNLRTLWQPLGEAAPAERAAEVKQLLPYLAHIHVYHWPQGKPVPLAEGEKEWGAVLDALAKANSSVRLLLEHVVDDAPEQFLEDVSTLRAWTRARE